MQGNTYTHKIIREKHLKLETEFPFQAEMKQSLHFLRSSTTRMFRRIPTVINFNICFLFQLAQWIKWWTCVLHIHANHLSHTVTRPAFLQPSSPEKSLQLKTTTEHHQTKPNPQNLFRETWPISGSFYHIVLWEEPSPGSMRRASLRSAVLHHLAGHASREAGFLHDTFIS